MSTLFRHFQQKLLGPLNCKKATNISKCKNFANVASRIDTLLKNLIHFATFRTQRNISPTASLQLHINYFKASVKVKTPHQKNWWGVKLNVFLVDLKRWGEDNTSRQLQIIYFALSRNIVAIYKNIIAIIAIVGVSCKIKSVWWANLFTNKRPRTAPFSLI